MISERRVVFIRGKDSGVYLAVSGIHRKIRDAI